jgi:uncharacterized protein
VTPRILGLALVATLLAAPASAQTSQGRIAVVGRGVVERAPDKVSVQVGVSTRGTTPSAAMDANSGAAARVVAFARQFGVEQRDLRTGSVTLSETFRTAGEPGRPRQEPDGYAATNTVTIVLRDIPRLGTLLRELLNQGANRINGVAFGLTDAAEGGDEARKAAIADATRKATLLAAAANVKLGRVLRIDDPPRAEARGGEAGDIPMRAAARGMAVPVEAGVIEIAAEVDVSWAIE